MLTFDAAAHEYRWDGVVVPSVTQIIEDAGLKPPYSGDGSAAKRGTKVHELLEAYDNETLDYDRWAAYDAKLPEERRLHPYLSAYLLFLQEARVEWSAVEERLYSEKCRVAGTVDRFGLVNDHAAILDFKTTDGIPPAKATAVQTAGYHTLFAEQRGLVSMGHVKRFALALHGDGTYKLIEYDDQQDYAAFKAAALLYHWKRQR